MSFQSIINYKSMFDLMKSFTLKYKDTIPDAYYCLLCKNIMINAYFSDCGCTFCYECITNYTADSSKYCFGKTVDCQNTTIDRDNITEDKKANITISKFEVQCPKQGCEIFVPLQKLENHIKECKKTFKTCDFSKIGCECCGENENSNYHISFLLKYIIELKKDFNDELGEIKEELHNLSNETISLRNENHQLKNKLNKLDSNVDADEEPIKKKNNKTMEEGNKGVCVKKGIIGELYSNCLEPTDDVPSSPVESWCKEWTIDKIFECRQNAVDNPNLEMMLSEKFLTSRNGYTMQLVVYPNGRSSAKNEYMSLFFMILAGNYDDNLEWPMKCTIKLSIISQTSSHHNLDKEYNYSTTPENYRNCFNKPENNNPFLGSRRFISWNDLINSDKGFIQNEKIIIRCHVLPN